MESLIGNLTSRLRHLWSKQPVPVALRSFRGQCDRPVFFRNSQCLACHTKLGYDVGEGRLLALEPDAQVAGIWRRFGHADESPAYRRCVNYGTASGCNWLLPQKLLDTITAVLNELSRSMGQQDFYPFALLRSAVAKLHFITLLCRNRTRLKPISFWYKWREITG